MLGGGTTGEGCVVEFGLAARIGVTRVLGRAAAVAGDPIMRLMHPPWRDAPTAHHDRLLAGPPVVRSRFGLVAVCSAELCTQLLRDRRCGVRTRAGGPPGGRPGPHGRDPVMEPIDLSFLALDPPVHTRLRKLAQPAFAPSRIRRYRERTGELARRLVEEAAERDGFDLTADVGARLSGGLIAEILGVPDGEMGRVLRCGGVIGEALGGLRSVRQARAVAAAEAELRALLAELLDHRRRHPREDLLTGLVEAVDTGAADRDEALAMALLLVLAGFETTSSLLGNAVAALLDPAPGSGPVWEWLCAAPAGRASAVVEETLRFDPPVRFTMRVPHSDIEVAGVPVAADTPILVLLAAAGRDPAVHVAPHVFDPTRVPASEHLAFAGGAHYCLGAPLARLEAEIALDALATRMPRLRRTGPGQRWTSPLLSGYRSLPVSGR